MLHMRALAATLLLVGSCQDWPRYSAEVGGDDTLRPVGTELEGLVAVEWTEWSETEEPNDLMWETPDELSLAVGFGAFIEGDLAGTGYAAATPTVWDIPGCANSPTIRAPEADADYTGDVDTYRVQLLEDATLCATAQVLPEVVYDLLVFSLDDCLLPGLPLAGANGEVLGLDGADQGWAVTLPAGMYAIQVAAWRPDDPNLLAPYRIELASTGARETDSVLCPAFVGGT